MAYITTSVEYGIHCLLWLVGDNQRALSSRELAELQGISPSFLAKIFPKLEKAGIVVASEGVRGGYRWRARRMRSVFWRSSTPSKGTSRCSIAKRYAGAAQCSTILRRIGRSPVNAPSTR